MVECEFLPSHIRSNNTDFRVDVVAKKSGGGREQAFVVFEEQSAATAALRGLSDQLFYKKALVSLISHIDMPQGWRQKAISYSKKPSNATLARTDPSLSRDAAAIQAAKLVVSRAQGEYEALEKEKEDADARVAQGQKRDLDGEGEERSGKKAKTGGDEDEEEMEMDEDDDGRSPFDLLWVRMGWVLMVDAPAAGVSSSKLICTNLPPECTEEIMGALFAQYVPPIHTSWLTII